MAEINPTFRLFFIALTILISVTVFGQKPLMVRKLNLTKIPKGMNYEGKVKTGYYWTDHLGYNILLTTETGIHKSSKIKHETEGLDAELFAYHYIVVGDSCSLIWRLQDYIYDCPVDMNVSFIGNTPTITDLDSNGVAEIWITYKVQCTGDVSPAIVKIMMYEGQKKFAIRGHDRAWVGIDDKGQKEYAGGEYKFDIAFVDAPSVFLSFAKNLWQKNLTQPLAE